MALIYTTIKYNNLPMWVTYRIYKYQQQFEHRHGHRPYDQTIYLKGRHYKYKICFVTVGQGQIDIQCERKKRIRFEL